MYDGLWDKWSHSLLPTPLNPLSPLFAVLDPYWLERKHKEDRPYPISGPMFTEGTPWGAVLNPTIGAFIKPEREEHYIRFRNGIDIVSLLHNANESIKERARDFTKTHYLTVKGGEISSVRWNAWNAPTPDISVVSLNTTSSGLAQINTGIYGVYGNGDENEGIGSSSGVVYDAYGVNKLGNMLGGTYPQNVAAGFNAFSDEPGLNKHLLAYAEPLSIKDSFSIATSDYDGRFVRHGEIVANEQGELGIYQNRPIYKQKGAHFDIKDRMAISAVTSTITQDDQITLLSVVDKKVSTKIVKGLNEELIRKSKQHVDSPYAVDDTLGATSTEKLSSYNPSQAMDLINDSDAVADLLSQGNGSDFVRNASTSVRLIGGIYGYMGSELVGLGIHNEKKLANSSDMYAFNRNFWDLNLGGAGGAVSEIGRRFIPNFSRLNNVNPLMNTMPSWLPERFRYGDPMCITENTLVEKNNMQFIIAKDIQIQDMLLSHKGKLKRTLGTVKRPVKDNEIIYQFQIASLTAVNSKYSEEHPLLIYDGKDIADVRYSDHNHEELSRYQRYNDIIICLLQGIVKKKDIALITGISIDWIYMYFKDLYKVGIIENYKTDKYNIVPIYDKLKLFDLDMIKNRLTWCKAKNIQVGDYVAYPIPKHNSTEIIVDMATITSCPYSDKYIYTSGQCQSQDFIEAYEWLEIYNNVLTHKRGERKQILERFGWNMKVYENAQSMIRQHKVPERMNRYVTLTSELCYAIGLYLAEGYHNSSGISYALNVKEEQLFNRSVQAFINAGFNVSSYSFRRQSNTNGAKGIIHCKTLLSFMDYLVGHLSHNKCLNDILWNLSDNNLLRLLEGYIDGDGCNHIIHCGKDNRISYRVSIASCNLTLLLQIRKLALRFGVIFKIQQKGLSQKEILINGKQINTGINYNASIIGRSAVHFAKLLWGIDIQIPEWKRKSPKHAFIYNGYVFMRVQSIVEYTKDNYPYVYGFSMENDKSFCTAGVATHNTLLPKGEMRLPGHGWLTLNELHPDQYSTPKDPYGSFDRFKILADIAPGSPEYRLWRDIAKRTVTSPELLEEMEQIKQRAREQGKKHDFYPYKIMGTSLDYKTVIVSEVLGQGKFRSGDTIYKMAGVTVKGNADENAQEVLSRYLHPGQKITIAYDEVAAYAKNKDTQKTTNVAVYINGEAVNKQMVEAGDAVERKSDKSAAATVGQLSGMQYLFGLASEVIGHADIPIISDQWLRIRSPYESYLAEQVYGTPYQSWAHPIQTFLVPAVERAIHERSIGDLLLFDAFHYVAEHERTPDIKTNLFGYNINIKSQQITRGPKQLMYTAAILGNRATLVGHAIGNLLDAGNARLSMPISTGLNLAVTAAHMIKGGNSLFDMMTLGAYVGKEVARINEVDSLKGKGKYAAVGAVIGGAYRLLHHGLFGDWIPDRQKQKYEMQDYWDRLTYIKYTGLYKEAARRALDEEGVDVEQFIKTQEEKEDIRKGALKKLKKIKDSLNEAYGGKTNYLKNYLVKLVNSRISELQPSEQIVEGGKYTQSAIIYKQAAEATIYGLKKGASWSSIVSALPANDREYFMEFVAETDKDKRDKILAIVSPSLKKALQMSWGMKPEKQQSNEDFFENHYLPDSDWQGWNPDVDLNDIYVKTINNEAMNLADFGFYDNALREPAVEKTTPLPFKHENDDINLSTELSKLLKGKGLKNVEVSVTSRNSMGPTDIIANIAVWAGLRDQQRKVEDTARTWI